MHINRIPPILNGTVPAHGFPDSQPQQHHKRYHVSNRRLHRNLSRKKHWTNNGPRLQQRTKQKVAAKNTNIKAELPPDFKRCLQRSATNTIVRDGVKAPLILRQLTGLGPKFVFPNKPKSNTEDIIGLTIAMRIVSDSAADSKTSKRMFDRFLQAVDEHYKKRNLHQPAKFMNETDRIDRYLSIQYKACVRFLTQHPDIIITESDKGHKTIISSKTALIKKRQDFIDQQIRDGVYTTFAKNQTMSWEQAMDEKRRLLAKAKSAEFACIIRTLNPIFKTDRAKGLQVPKYGEIKRQAFQMAKMSIAMKAHKGDVFPIRPIIAAPDAMGADLEAFILLRLERIYAAHTKADTTEYNNIAARMQQYRFIARDSQHVHQELQHHHIPANHQMYTVDFANMYTNINISAAITIISARYDDIIAPTTSMPKNVFIHALQKILQLNEHFSAGMRVYRQAKGLPMGGKLSYALSEIVTSEGLRAAVDEATSSGIEISYIAKYVDDILIITNGKHQHPSGVTNTEAFKTLLSNNIVGMPITHEEETDCGDHFEIKYLNMAIIRRKVWCAQHAHVSTKWTMQPYATGRIMNAWSAHTTQAKTTIIKEHLRTAIKVSSPEHHMAVIQHSYNILRTNGYRNKAIMLCLREVCADENIDFATAMNIMDKEQHDNPDGNHCQGGIADCNPAANIRATPIPCEYNAQPQTIDNNDGVQGCNDITLTLSYHNDKILAISDIENIPPRPKKRRRRVKCAICCATMYTWTNETSHAACITGSIRAGDPLQARRDDQASNYKAPKKPTSDRGRPQLLRPIPSRHQPHCNEEPARHMMSQPADGSDTQILPRLVFASQQPECRSTSDITQPTEIVRNTMMTERQMMTQPAEHSDTQTSQRWMFASQCLMRTHMADPKITVRSENGRPAEEPAPPIRISDSAAPIRTTVPAAPIRTIVPASLTRTTASASTQTKPTKGRAGPTQLPTHNQKPACNFEFFNPRQFDYISAPYIRGLTETVQLIIASEGLTCTLMHRQQPNRLFTALKDKTPVTERAMVTFSVTCHTCGTDLFYNAIDTTVGEVISNLSTLNTPALTDHAIAWKEPRIVRVHTTANKAQIALGIYRGTIAADPGSPHNTTASNKLPESITSIMRSYHATASNEVDAEQGNIN